MQQFPFASVGFDLDGTLVDSSADLAAAVNHALAADGRAPLPVAEVVAMTGGGARLMLERALDATGGAVPAPRLDALHAMLLDHYADHIADHTRLYPGAAGAIADLAGRGVALAVVTNKLERFARTLLEALGIADRFVTIIGGDTLGKAKPSPEPLLAMAERLGGGRAAFVGDSRYDVAAARAAGMPVVACAFGFSSEPVAQLGADAVIAGFDALVPALARL